MIAWLTFGALGFGLAIGLAVVMALRRATRAATTGQPSPIEAKIHADAQRARDQLPAPNAEAVHGMTDQELEDAANDPAPLVPPRK